MTNHELLTGIAQQNLLMRHHAAQTHRVYVNIVDHGTARAQRIGGGGVRACTHASLRAGGGHLAGGVHSGTGGGVHLVRVVNLNDFYRFEVACRLRRELGGENRTNREVRGDEHTHLGVLGQQFAQGVQALGGPTGRTNHRVHTVLHRETHIRLAGFGNCQVNNNLCAGIDQLLQVIATAQCRHQVHVCGGVDGAHRLRAHAACGTEYRYLPDFFVALVGHLLSSVAFVHPDYGADAVTYSLYYPPCGRGARHRTRWVRYPAEPQRSKKRSNLTVIQAV